MVIYKDGFEIKDEGLQSTPAFAKLPVISRSISSQIQQLRNMIENGYGRTGKPLPPKRVKKLKETLAQLEASQNGL